MRLWPVDRYNALQREAAVLVKGSRVVVDIGGGDRSSAGSNLGGFAFDHVLTVDRFSTFRPDIVADAHALPFKRGSVDAALCFSVLEHLENPGSAVEEAYGILSDTGCLIGYVPFLYPYHGSPFDYSRFTSTGLEMLLAKFPNRRCAPWGDYLLVSIGFLVGFNMRVLRMIRPLTFLLSIPMGCMFSVAVGRRALGRSFSESALGHLFIACK